MDHLAALEHECVTPEARSVLDATREVIAERLELGEGIEPTAVQYFSAFVGTLLDSDAAAGPVLGAHLALLSAVLPFVPTRLLQSHFYPIAEAIASDLVNQGQDDEGVATPALACLGSLLRAQSQSWTRPQTVAVYNQVLAFTLDPRPNVYKCAQDAVALVFDRESGGGGGGGGGGSTSTSPVPGDILITFWRRMLLDEPGTRTQELERNGSLILVFAKQLIGSGSGSGSFSSPQLDAICQLALDAAAAPFPAIHRMAWLLLDLVTSNPKTMPSVAVVALAIDSLFKNRPPLQDPAATLVHVRVLRSCVVKLDGLDPSHSLTSAILKPAVDTLVRDFASRNEGVIEAVVDALVELVDICIDPAMRLVQEAVHWSSLGAEEKHGNTPVLVAVINSICDRGMQSRYRAAWMSVLSVVEHLFDGLSRNRGGPGASASTSVLLEPTVQVLFQMLLDLKSADAKDKDDVFDLQLGTALEKTLGSAVRTMGPLDFHRALGGKGEGIWKDVAHNPAAAVDSMSVSVIVNLLQQHAHDTQLGFFVAHIYPAAEAAGRQAAKLRREKSLIHQSVNHLSFRLFGLLPSFCAMPTDLLVAFPGLAPKLGAILDASVGASAEAPADDRIPVICNALKSLIDTQSKATEGSGSGSGSSASRLKALQRKFKEEADVDNDDDHPGGRKRRDDGDDEAEEDVEAEEGDEDTDIAGPDTDAGRSGDMLDMEQAQANVACLASFAKNYMPLLHKLIVKPSVPDKHRAILLQTISAYARIAPSNMLRGYFGSCLSGMIKVTTNIADAGQDTAEVNKLLYVRMTLADLINTLLPVLEPGADSEVMLSMLWRALVPQLSDGEGAFQKRSYHIFEALCAHHGDWVSMNKGMGTGTASNSNANEMLTVILGCVEACHASARKSRLRALTSLMPYVDDARGMIQQILPEVLLMLKEPNRTLRQGSMDALAEMADWWVGKRKGKKAQAEYAVFVNHVAAGLAGRTTQMISASVLALAWLMFVLAGKLPAETPDQLIGTIVLLFGQTSTPLVRSVLSFIKICTNPEVVPTEVLQANLPRIIPGLLAWSGHTDQTKSRVSYRLQVRVILERMLRRFDYDSLLSLFPEADRRFLANIQKEMSRKARRKAEKREAARRGRTADPMAVGVVGSNAGAGAGADDDVAGFSREAQKRAGAVGLGMMSTVIREGGTGDVDLMDPSAARHMVSAEAANRAMRKRARDEDGEDSDAEFGDGVKELKDGRVQLIEAPTDSEASSDEEDGGDDGDSDSDGDGEGDGGDGDGDVDMGMGDGAGRGGRASRGQRPAKRSRTTTSMREGDGGAEMVGAGPRPQGRYAPTGGKKWWVKDRSGGSRGGGALTGREFKAKKAKGDAGKPAEIQPFAYIPLGKLGGGGKSGSGIRGPGGRKAKKMAAELAGVIGGAKKGAARGSKARLGDRDRRRRKR